MKQASAVRSTTSIIAPRFSWLAVMSESELVGALRIIGARQLTGYGIAQIDELTPLTVRRPSHPDGV
jgi:hypothetical protein